MQRDFYPYDEGFELSDLGSATCSAVPGTLRVYFSVNRASGGASERIRDTVPETIEVQEGIARQTFQISIPPEDLARALERLNR